ncbi:MAG TPA: SulP family inorganic anion transporter, partial [Acidimicrobiales bacterium]|nr:SulP family inorganic anion transporter [Acidimicrobiales bacterium]
MEKTAPLASPPSKAGAADLLAGLSVALVLIPQSMAYAELAGLPPHIGLFASTLPLVAAALCA